VHLKLTHRKFLERSSGDHALAVREPVEGTYDSAAFKRIAERLTRTERPDVLDLGVLSGDAVTTLATLGARVHVHDLVTPLREGLRHGSPDAKSLLADLKILPESLDVVLAWELLDLLPMAEARQTVLKLHRWLKPKGLLLAVFHAVSASGIHRFRLTGDGLVRMERVAPLLEPCPARTNSEALSIFSGFTLLHSALMRTQIREVLGQRNEG
jgi:hypothetical protein